MRQFLLLITVLFSASCHNETPDTEQLKQVRIAIQELGEIAPQYVKEAENALKKNYKANIILLEPKPLPEKSRSAYSAQRFRADSLLRFLDRINEQSPDRIIGITHADISVSKQKEPYWKYKDWAVFGLGSCPGKSCVVSYHRLGARKASEKIKIERFRKICVHEIGHTLGLKHCSTNACVMNDAAEKIATIDAATESLCRQCKIQIGHLAN